MAELGKSGLLAVRLPPSPVWLRIIEEAWETGAAVLPVDHRLPDPEVRRLLAAARPTALLDERGGPVRLEGGVALDPEVALVVATSGTGGRPKAVELSHAAVRAAVESSAARLGSGPRDPWLCCLPVEHVGGMLVLLRALLLGAPVAVHARFDVEDFERERDARFTAVVPTMLARLLEAGADLARFRAILVGGAALSSELAARADEAGARVVATYGLTESCGGVVYDGAPLDALETAVGRNDEILLRGPTIMRGYRLDRHATAAALATTGWLRTRDAGAIIDGRLTVQGRMDDVIVSGGEKVWPEEVETVLRAHPAVRDAAVCGRPDPEWGERVVAYVIPADPSHPPALAEVREFVAARLARHKAPREIVAVSSLPRTPSGKLRRALIRGRGL
ncbi:MAG: class I adenylate-forming enzyme family protein [Actinomycetota bacterium]